MKIEFRKVKDLKEYQANPRNNEEAVDYVAKSIKEFGFKNPILIDENDEIVAGHTRLLACKKLGIKEVPTIKIDDLTEDQIRAFRLADNKVAEIATWNEDLLKFELSEIEMDLSDFGFEDEISGLCTDGKETEVVEDEYEVELPEEPKAQLGDIYILGDHRLMCGDATKDDVKLLLNGDTVNLFLTDPPYNVDYEGKTKDKLKIQNDKMENASFKAFLIDAFKNANSAMNAGATYYIWHADLEGYNFRSACAEIGWTVRQCLIWNKNSMVMGRQDYQWKHEPCLYGWKDGAAHNWYSDRKQTTVLEFNRPSRNKLHPTMKPIDLISYQIQNSTKENDKVLDLFGGSGSTLIACEQLNRKCYMMELDPKYVDVIINRWETFTGKKAVKL